MTDEDDRQAAEELAYTRGKRFVWARLVQEGLIELGYDNSDEKLLIAKLVAEREESIGKLRDACDEWGDNDWTNDLNLADVIEKHLVRYLQEPPSDEG